MATCLASCGSCYYGIGCLRCIIMFSSNVSSTNVTCRVLCTSFNSSSMIHPLRPSWLLGWRLSWRCCSTFKTIPSFLVWQSLLWCFFLGAFTNVVECSAMAFSLVGGILVLLHDPFLVCRNVELQAVCIHSCGTIAKIQSSPQNHVQLANSIFTILLQSLNKCLCW